MSEPDSTSVSYGYCHCGCGRETQLARQTYRKLGWIKGEPIRYINGHQCKRPAEDRFWGKVHKTPGCWHWQGSKDKDGYGQFSANRIPIKAHRFSYKLHFGEIPAKLFVCHRCDCPDCVAPYHLFIATHSENQYDALNKGRHTSQVRTRNGSQKLSDSQVRKLRQLHATGKYKQQELADKFDIGHKYVSKLIRNKARLDA